MNSIKVSNSFIQISLFLFILSQNLSASALLHEKCSLQNSECLKGQAQATLHTFVKSIPELGIKSLDVLRLDDILFDTQQLRYEMRNIEVGGLNNTIIDDLSINMTLKLFRLSFHTTLMLDCDYKLDGLLFEIPVFGDGRVKSILRNLQMEMMIIFDIVKNEQGKDVMDIKKYFYGANALGGVQSNLGNLFNGDEAKSDIVHEIINKNWRTLVANFGRIFSTKIADSIFDAIKKYMRSQPLEDLALM